MRFQYRVSQFWRTLFAKTSQSELEQVLVGLNQSQKALFMRMQPGEQNHAAIVYRRLLEQGEVQTDLLVAARLHDVGKLRYPMHPLQRAMVVLGRSLVPKLAHRWGEIPDKGWESLPAWRKAFVVADNHATWGAELARQVGVSALTENLIRQHDQSHGHGADTEEASLLRKLQLVDNES